MTDGTAKLGPLGQMARGVSLALFAYWGSYALLAPATNLDSLMYHLARLELAWRGGLFDNDGFTSVYDLMWPWTFDAVHLPFLRLGWGYALPSFLCLVGTAVVAHRMMRARFGLEAAWVAVLSLLGLTCLVYQATSTKNDIPLLFCGAVWVYARWRRRQDGRAVHLAWMVLALGFMAGAKTTGLLYAAILGAWTLWELRSDRARLRRVALGGLGALLLFGSGETYVESARVLGHPLGTPDGMQRLRNHDGLRGAFANFTRYVAGSVYLGPTPVGEATGAIRTVVRAEQALLRSTGLTDQGADARIGDSSLFFFQSGLEELSGFGPLGSLAMIAMLAALVRWRPRAVWWRLASAALGGLLVVSFTIGYNYWCNRYLIAWYALATLAVVAALWERDAPSRRLLRWGLAACAAASAIAAPLLSFNRRPADFVAAVRERERLETAAYPLSGEVRDRLRAWHRARPASRIYFVVCNDSILLPLLEEPALAVQLLTPTRFGALLADDRLPAGDLVIQDCPSGTARLRPLEEVAAPDIFSRGHVRTQMIYEISR